MHVRMSEHVSVLSEINESAFRLPLCYLHTEVIKWIIYGIKKLGFRRRRIVQMVSAE